MGLASHLHLAWKSLSTPLVASPATTPEENAGPRPTSRGGCAKLTAPPPLPPLPPDRLGWNSFPDEDPPASRRRLALDTCTCHMLSELAGGLVAMDGYTRSHSPWYTCCGRAILASGSVRDSRQCARYPAALGTAKRTVKNSGGKPSALYTNPL